MGFISLKRQVIFFSHQNKNFLFIQFFFSLSGFQLSLRRQLLHTRFASLIVLFLPFLCLLFCACSYTVFFLRVSSRETIHANFSVGGHSYIVDITFRITTCRSLLAIAFRTQDLVCINLSFASRDFVCPRMTSIRIALFVFVHRRGHHALRESSSVSLAHGPRWLSLLSRHRKAFLLLLIRSLL